jgi:hypothetical protein
VQRWAVALGCAEIEVADDIAPYSKAIEETAKATGKALDLVRDGTQAISRPVAQIYGLLIGDKIDASRERNLDAISRETRKILIGRDLAETAPVAEQIAIPLLEAARGETRKEMQALWAQLLANAMDPARRDDVRPEFIRYLEQFHPVDALVLRALGLQDKSVLPSILAEAIGIRTSSVIVSLANLESFRCVDSMKMSDAPIFFFTISNLGSELLLALS